MGLVFHLLIVRNTGLRILGFASVVLACFTLSFAIEFAQIYLPSRSPSHLDLLGNSLGGCIAATIGIRLSIYNEQRS
ncbi:MAG: VanZ family protein [Opitutales bacterium]|nr:VanZ family protein [Opitutales bacterium]MBT5813723.1 VanZ family protein [Opitutales bacterium]MBT6381648.1 VanZ family protein [Opitutales bacterium]MBT6767833.1 VanZ family protein [Opitutales bacterium]MBT7867670.1 VanZ family protein [Opitutales bacterium]